MHRLVRGNTMTPTFTRARRGLGVFHLECAMDELAGNLGIDPIELRERNLTEVDPNTGHPWSSFGLRECLERGAARLAGPGATSRPRSKRDGNWLIGTGMACAGYPIAFFMHTQRARAHLYADGSAIMQTATQEFGTGTATVMTQVAADGLGVDLASMRLSSATPTCQRRLAGRLERRHDDQLRGAQCRHGAARQLIALAVSDAQSPLHGADPAGSSSAAGGWRCPATTAPARPTAR